MIALLAVGIGSAGATARWAILGTGLFCPVMWSNIFSLALQRLGPFAKSASALLITAISGSCDPAAVAGRTGGSLGIQASFLVPLLAMPDVAALCGIQVPRRTAQALADPRV